MRFEHSPETDGFGLVLLPELIDPKRVSYFAPLRYSDSVNRHHLYWPRSLYVQDELSSAFREHPFNSVWLLKSDHVQIHRQYDGVAIPDSDVMATFMDEAGLLESLQVSIKAIGMIDAAVMAGRVRKLAQSESNKSRHLEIVGATIKRIKEIEVLNSAIAKIAVENAQMYLEDAVLSWSA